MVLQIGGYTASQNNQHALKVDDSSHAVAGCGPDVALREPTGCMFAVSWIRHLAIACGDMFTVHTICPLQLSCPLPRGPQTRQTDLDPHVTPSLSHHLHILSLCWNFGLLLFQQKASSELWEKFLESPFQLFLCVYSYMSSSSVCMSSITDKLAS